MTVGDVYWIELPGSAGRAQAGRRPAIIVQSSALNGARLPTVLVIPLTTQLASLRFPGTVLVEPDSTNGLRQPSIALVFQLSAIDRSYVASPLGTVLGSVMASLFQALDELTGRTKP